MELPANREPNFSMEQIREVLPLPQLLPRPAAAFLATPRLCWPS